MKVLIGTPIHQSEDKQIKKWLQKVSSLTLPADLLMVDSSPGIEYAETVGKYCADLNINPKIKHFEFHQSNGTAERIGRSREFIRQEVLSKGYDAWFSWEINQVIPTHTLEKLTEAMAFGNFSAVGKYGTKANDYLGCALVSREALKATGFLLSYPDTPDCWHKGGNWFKDRLIKNGDRCVEIKIGFTINPIIGKSNIRLNSDNRSSVNNLPDSSIAAISVEENLISFLSQDNWHKFKKELTRLLILGGQLKLSFWNFEYLLRSFIEANEKDRWTQWWPLIFGSQKNQDTIARNGFTLKRLVSDLSDEGFVNFIQRQTNNEGYVELTCSKYQ